MKKLLSIIVLGLLLSGNAYSEKYIMKNCKPNSNNYLKHWGPSDITIDTNNKTVSWSNNIQNSDFDYESGNLQSGFTYKVSPFWTDIEKSYAIYTYDPINSKVTVDVYSPAIFSKKLKYQSISNDIAMTCDQTSTTTNNSQSAGISFTIKDKKEQCAAIGFKPETDKFADCVLRLVELDVKKQQTNKISTAQNSGNDALAKQLKQQQYDRDTQYLLDLGQQLLQPKSSSYSTCSYIDLGSGMSKVKCN